MCTVQSVSVVNAVIGAFQTSALASLSVIWCESSKRTQTSSPVASPSRIREFSRHRPAVGDSHRRHDGPASFGSADSSSGDSSGEVGSSCGEVGFISCGEEEPEARRDKRHEQGGAHAVRLRASVENTTRIASHRIAAILWSDMNKEKRWGQTQRRGRITRGLDHG